MNKLKPGHIFKPENALCCACRNPIAFKLMDSGKWCPTNPDGSDHWDDCSMAKWQASGGIQYETAGVHTGKNFKKNYDKTNNTVPWEATP